MKERHLNQDRLDTLLASLKQRHTRARALIRKPGMTPGLVKVQVQGIKTDADAILELLTKGV